MNDNSPAMNWTALFNPGETVRLRFINAATMSNFDVRIPGLDMDVVMVDGKAVRPVSIGLGEEGWRVLTYQDLVSAEPQVYEKTPEREMTVNITANMERYMFSFDGKKFTEHPGPYLFRHNERLRLFLVNHTMMEHPIHLHGMWMQLENGAESLPYKHTVLVKPGEVLSALITPVEKGDWAFHCHLLYHMEAGMFQVVRVAS